MFIKKFFLFIILYALEVSSPQYIREPSDLEDKPIHRVVNGYPGKLGDVPYQVAFKALINRGARLYTTFCGGVIIAPTKLLSAAHCFEEKGKSRCTMFKKTVTVSKRKLRSKCAVAGNLHNTAVYGSGGQWKYLNHVIYPAKYKFPKLDIAVVMLTSPFAYNAHVKNIPMATRHLEYKEQCLVSGYGRTNIHIKKATSEVLLLAKLDIINTRTCNALHGRNMANFVCTSSAVSDVGQGDSGGPLVCKGTGDPAEKTEGVLVGIVSGHRYRAGSFFTRVTSYVNFIAKNKGMANKNSMIFCLIPLIHILISLF